MQPSNRVEKNCISPVSLSPLSLSLSLSLSPLSLSLSPLSLLPAYDVMTQCTEKKNWLYNSGNPTNASQVFGPRKRKGSKIH